MKQVLLFIVALVLVFSCKKEQPDLRKPESNMDTIFYITYLVQGKYGTEIEYLDSLGDTIRTTCKSDVWSKYYKAEYPGQLFYVSATDDKETYCQTTIYFSNSADSSIIKVCDNRQKGKATCSYEF